jgi:hypothetical protein
MLVAQINSLERIPNSQNSELLLSIPNPLKTLLDFLSVFVHLSKQLVTQFTQTVGSFSLLDFLFNEIVGLKEFDYVLTRLKCFLCVIFVFRDKVLQLVPVSALQNLFVVNINKFLVQVLLAKSGFHLSLSIRFLLIHVNLTF